MYKESDITKPEEEKRWLRGVCIGLLSLVALTAILGLYNICLLRNRTSKNQRTLTILFYFCSFLAMFSTTFALVWYIIDPSLGVDKE